MASDPDRLRDDRRGRGDYGDFGDRGSSDGVDPMYRDATVLPSQMDGSTLPRLPALRTAPVGGNSLGVTSERSAQRDAAWDDVAFSPRVVEQGAMSGDPTRQDVRSDPQSDLRRDAWRGTSQPGSRLAERRLNVFQRFVAETTGRRLPIFGEDLFDGLGPSARYAPTQNVAVPDDYVLGVDDTVQLRVWGAVEGDLALTVDRNGQITIPKVGPVTVAGVQASQLHTVLKRAIGNNFTGFDASASLSRLRSIQVYVVGQAKRPGAYTVSSLSTLVNALFESGGPGPNGSMRQVALRRRGALVGTVDLYGFITKGASAGDRHLLPGDVIVIPPAGPRVALLGALDGPAIYELRNGKETLGEVLGYAGGKTAVTSIDTVTIERIDAGSSLTTPGRRVETRKLDEHGLRSGVHDGDVITLQKINADFRNAITLRGNVAAPLRHPHHEGMHLSDLLPEPDALLTPDYFARKNRLIKEGGPGHRQSTEVGQEADRIRSLVDEPNWRYAVIERLDRQRLTTRLLPFDLGAVVHKTDPAQNLALEPGDIVTIFGSKDMRLPQADHTRLIRVEGEVASAGVYAIQPGDTLHTILERAGGITPSAYLFGAEFTREQTRRQQETNLEEAIRRMDQQSSARLAALMVNLSGAGGTNDAMTKELAAQQQRRIVRLRSMKPTGRVSLELDTGARRIADLPNLGLDNGDTLYIPPRPSFVTVIGAVNNENAIVWREGRTVSDALRVAGIQQDIADISRAFVLRADGSIHSRDATSWRKSLESTVLMPGDTVVVPEKMDPRSTMTKVMAGLKDWSQVISQLGLGVAAIRVLNR